MTHTSPEHAEDDAADTSLGRESLSGSVSANDGACPDIGPVSPMRRAAEEEAPGEHEDFEAVVAEHESALLRYARHQLGRDYEGRDHDAQDIVQEALLRLHRQWRQDGQSGLKNVRAWLMRVTHNLVIDALRKRSRQRAARLKLMEDATQTCDDASIPIAGAAALEAGEAAEQAMRLLHELPDTQQRILMLRLNDLTVREIADVLNMSPGNVGYHVNQALLTLARQLKLAGVV